MSKVLIVEDHAQWQRILAEQFMGVLGEENVYVVDNYRTALSKLGDGYAAFVLDGNFPEHAGGGPELLGIQLAEEIRQREGSYERVAMVSFEDLTLKRARELGIEKTYSKASPDEISRLIDDLRPLF